MPREDQETLDRLFDHVQYHAQVMAYAAMPLPMEPILASMLIEIQQDLLNLQKQLQSLKPQQAETSDQWPALRGELKDEKP